MAERSLKLIGYQFSVYTRVVAMCLIEKGLAFDYEEMDPFGSEVPDHLHGLNPFGRVPVLVHQGFSIYETAAITRFLDARFPKMPLTPIDPLATARMQQVIGIVDAYGYRALVRQVFSNAVFRPLEGLECDLGELAAGIRESRKVLFALEQIALEGRVLTGQSISLADLHLVPMIAYFRLAKEGTLLLAEHPAISAWWSSFATRSSTVKTNPDLTKVRASR
jgi:glutathione S-transferase